MDGARWGQQGNIHWFLLTRQTRWGMSPCCQVWFGLLGFNASPTSRGHIKEVKPAARFSFKYLPSLRGRNAIKWRHLVLLLGTN